MLSSSRADFNIAKQFSYFLFANSIDLAFATTEIVEDDLPFKTYSLYQNCSITNWTYKAVIAGYGDRLEEVIDATNPRFIAIVGDRVDLLDAVKVVLLRSIEIIHMAVETSPLDHMMIR